MKAGRKITGGRYVASRKKKLFERTGQKKIVKLSEDKRKTKKVKGGILKTFLLGAKYVNVNGKKAEIKNVLETPSNKFLARQNIITKGTILDTTLGKVKVTNRPTQEGVLNGIVIKEKKE